MIEAIGHEIADPLELDAVFRLGHGQIRLDDAVVVDRERVGIEILKHVALAAAGATFDDVVKITTYVVDYTPEMRSVIGEVRGRYLPAENPPASTLVGVSALAGPEWLIEIEAIAVTD